MLRMAPIKANTGAVEYYLARSQGCGPEMTREAIADYYMGNREAAGAWVGTGAAALGLAGEIDPGAFRQLLLDGKTPDGTARTRPVMRTNKATGEKYDDRDAGIDAVLRAPKSVSVLWALGDTGTQAQVIAAHDHAAREAVRYLETVAAHARRGHAGVG